MSCRYRAAVSRSKASWSCAEFGASTKSDENIGDPIVRSFVRCCHAEVRSAKHGSAEAAVETSLPSWKVIFVDGSAPMSAACSDHSEQQQLPVM